MTDKIYLINCRKCGNNMQVIIRGQKIYGRTKKCVYCARYITLNRMNVIRRVNG